MWAEREFGSRVISVKFNTYGGLVKRLRRSPLTAESRVRFPDPSLIRWAQRKLGLRGARRMENPLDEIQSQAIA